MVNILLADGFEESEALVPADLLRRAGVEVALVGVDGGQVAGAHGITVAADKTLKELDREQVELLMLPGGLGGVEAIRKSAAAMELIQYCVSQGRWVAAICAAPTVLAQLGITDGKQAVCYPGMEDQMGAAQVQKGSPVVADGRVITGEAAGAAFDFGLKLVEALRGAECARQVKNAVYYRH